MGKGDKNSDRKKMPKGNIDGIYGNKLAGWFYCGNDDSSSVLSLAVDGVECAEVRSSLHRPDVFTTLGIGPNCGFEFDLSLIANEKRKGIFELTISQRLSGYDFGGVKILYCDAVSRHYDALSELFYPEFYRCKYGIMEKTNDEAFQYFLFFGLYEGHSPNPWFCADFYEKHKDASKRRGDCSVELLSFLDAEESSNDSPSELLDIPYYSVNNPDLAGVKSLYTHYSVHGFKEGRVGAPRALPGNIVKELEKVAKIDPLVATARPGLDKVTRYPAWTQATYIPTLVSNRFGNDIKVIICVPFISRGGADLISTFLFKAYQSKYGKRNVLLIVTDGGGIDVPEWLDQDSRILDLDKESSYVDEEEKLVTANIIISQLAPEKIINVNSKLLWEIYERYGKQLSYYIDIYAYLFCFDYNKERDRVGYIVEFLPQTINYLTAVYFDNKKIINDINELYGFTCEQQNKLAAVYVPAADNIGQIYTSFRAERRKILWVGRLSLQKRPDILVDIAKEMPLLQFEVYGPPGNSSVSNDIITGSYSNIMYRGLYNDLCELDIQEYALFLNTSEWDGLPTVLIQMMAIGIPIVSTSVCGIKELLNDQRGWLVEPFDDIEAYTFTIRKAIIDRHSCAIKSGEARKHANSVHNWLNFLQDLEDNLAFVDHKKGGRMKRERDCEYEN